MASINIRQHDISDCGAACIASVCSYYKLQIPISRIRQYTSTDKHGTTVLGLVEAAEQLKFDAKGVRGKLESLYKIPLPAIAHVKVDNRLLHFVVIYKVERNKIHIMDPRLGKLEEKLISDFEKDWTGVLVLLLPSDNFIERNEKIHVYNRFWNLLKPHTTVLIQTFLGAIVYSIIGLSISIYIEKITDYVIPRGDTYLLNKLSIIILVLIIVQFFVGYVKNTSLLKMGQQIDASLMLGYYKHLLNLPQKFFDTMRIGEIISRFNDAMKIRKFINDTLMDILLNICIVTLSLFLMLLYSWNLFIMILSILPIYTAIYMIANKLNRKTERQVMEQAAKVESNLVESIGSIYTIKSMGIENYAYIKTESNFINFLEKIYTSGKNSIFSILSSSAISKIYTILLFWIGTIYVLDKELSLGVLFSFYTLFSFLVQPMISIIQMNTTMQNALIAADRLFEIFDLDLEYPNEKEVNIDYSTVKSILISGLGFRYGAKNEVFKEMNLEIDRGSFTVLTGESGTGKSTLLSLMQNIYLPQNGKITLGSNDIKHIKTKQLRSFIACVPQQIDLYKGSLIENISLGDFQPDIQKISKLIHDFNITEFFTNFSNGLNTFVNEKGNNLSGGQKQIIGILRSFYKNPEIILMDECTSALDLQTEKIILNVLQDYCKNGKTIVFVTHRISVMKMADKVVYIKDKRVCEEGKFGNLLTNNSSFLSYIENSTYS